MASQIVKCMNEHNLLYDLQHEFREKRSCETQLTMLVQDIARNASKGNLILLDFSKVFYRVNHSKSIWKLHQYVIRSNVLCWVQAFLSNRFPSVVVDGEESDSVPVCSGVPRAQYSGRSCSSFISTTYLIQLPAMLADDTVVYLATEGEKAAQPYNITMTNCLCGSGIGTSSLTLDVSGDSGDRVQHVQGAKMHLTGSMAWSGKLLPAPDILGLISQVT